MRAVIYIRVSDDEQVKEGYSIAAQESLLRRKCEEWGFDIIGSPYVDEGFSAKNTKRPFFQKMLSELEKNRIKVIVFWRLDRFSRNSRDFQKVTEVLEKKGCGIKSATEPIDTTTAMGRFQLELTISLGQLERETTSERVFFVMDERHRKGLRNGAVAPYGYILEEGKLTINPVEAEVVKRIFELYQFPMSSKAIAKMFNQEGIRRKEGGLWSDFSVMYILKNPVYCGHQRWNYRKLAGKRTYSESIVENTHEGIISVEEFDIVQGLRESRAFNREKVHSDFCFTGVLRCSRCGYGMIGVTFTDSNSKKKSRSYRCLGRANLGVCNMPVLREDKITEVFLNSLKPGSALQAKLLKAPEESEIDKDLEQDQIVRELEAIAKRRKKWQEAFAVDAMTIDELKAHMKEETTKEESLRSRMNPVPSTKMKWNRDELGAVLSTIQSVWGPSDEISRKRFIKALFKEIIVDTVVERGQGGPGKFAPPHIVSWKLNE